MAVLRRAAPTTQSARTAAPCAPYTWTILLRITIGHRIHSQNFEPDLDPCLFSRTTGVDLLDDQSIASGVHSDSDTR